MSAKECRKAEEIEITPEMIAAGLKAWREDSGDEYPVNSMSPDETVTAIFSAMYRAIAGIPRS